MNLFNKICHSVDHLVHRVMAETPVLFKRIRAIGASLFAFGTGIVALKNQVHIPEVLEHLSTQFITIGAVSALVAQITCTKPEDLPKPGGAA